jgi:hypothetical protein
VADDTPGLPARRHASLDRSALERVLSRAAELQALDGEAAELISEQRLIEIGAEVGLSSRHLRQAIAEEQTRIPRPADRGGVVRYFGPAVVEARRVVRGSCDSVLMRLERWMDRDECLRPKRRVTGRVTWEARRDFLGSIKRGFNVGGRGYALSSAFEVGAAVTQLEDDSVLVQLSADYGAHRRRSIWSAVATSGSLALVSVVLVTVSVPFGATLPIAGAMGAALLAGGAGAATAIAKSSRELVARGQLSLEQALDQLEVAPAQPASVLSSFLDAAARDLK